MVLAVVDTNVILVANGMHKDASPECVIACVMQLNRLIDSGVLVVDDGYRIILEYQNKIQPSKGKGVGDQFVKWALRHLNKIDKVHQIPLNEASENCYSEFPDAGLEPLFDPPDRKFVAVASAHPNSPPVWQAVDCKWIDWRAPLHASGISVEFLCKEDICRFYAKKFPQKLQPELP